MEALPGPQRYQLPNHLTIAMTANIVTQITISAV